MQRLILLLMSSLWLISCKSGQEYQADSNVTDYSKANLSTLQKALAVFDVPQIVEAERYISTLDLAQFLPDLDKDELLLTFEKIVAQRVLNKDALVILIQRLTRIDSSAADVLVRGLNALEESEVAYLKSLIHYTKGENDLSSLVQYFVENEELLSDMRCGSFDGDDLRAFYWYRYYQHFPEAIHRDSDIFLDDSAYLLAKIGRCEFKELENISSDQDDISYIESMILEYGALIDIEKTTQWLKSRPLWKKKKLTPSGVYKYSKQEELLAYATISEGEKDLLLLAVQNPNSILLQLDKLTHLKEADLKRLTFITTHNERYIKWEKLTLAASFYYAKLNPLAAYTAVYDSSYSTERSYVASFPLLELVKIHSDLAALEFAKLSRWPMVHPTHIPIGYFPPLSINFSFSFCSRLAQYYPETSLDLGGKYLDYPDATVWGYAENRDSLTGIAYGLSKLDKELVLIDRFLLAPNEWIENEKSFREKLYSSLEGIAIHSFKKWQYYAPILAAKYKLDESDMEEVLLYSEPELVLSYYQSKLRKNEDLDPENLNYYIQNLNENNPILARKLTTKYGFEMKLEELD